mmetsp:Transcript_78585/g.244769  ORF Transcript_78585/g.244769 Transcript_78585/m.244769 type:complete len:211 (-) Transcript_78585:430-1062(-)
MVFSFKAGCGPTDDAALPGRHQQLSGAARRRCASFPMQGTAKSELQYCKGWQPDPRSQKGRRLRRRAREQPCGDGRVSRGQPGVDARVSGGAKPAWRGDLRLAEEVPARAGRGRRRGHRWAGSRGCPRRTSGRGRLRCCSTGGLPLHAGVPRELALVGAWRRRQGVRQGFGEQCEQGLEVGAARSQGQASGAEHLRRPCAAGLPIHASVR